MLDSKTMWFYYNLIQDESKLSARFEHLFTKSIVWLIEILNTKVIEMMVIKKFTTYHHFFLLKYNELIY